MSEASWRVVTDFTGITFHDFNRALSCNADRTQTLLALNPESSDKVDIYHFTGTTLDNVEEDAIAYIMDPPSGWANLTDCGTFPCTAPENVIIKFYETTYEGDTTPSFDYEEF
jgi:hypothetical protein